MKQISIAFIITCLVGCFCPDQEKKSKKGKPLPDFKLQISDSSNWAYEKQKSVRKQVALCYFDSQCSFCNGQTNKFIEYIYNLKGEEFYFMHPFHFIA